MTCRVLFTSSARHQLLDRVAELASTDPHAARELVEGVARSLRDAARVDSPAPAMADVEDISTSTTDDTRLFMRARGDTMWVLAVWPGNVSRSWPYAAEPSRP